MAAGKPVKVAFVADTSDLKKSLAQAEASMNDVAAEAKSAGDKIDTAFSSVADVSDGVASATSQAAGGMGDLGGALSLLPGPLGSVGSAMEGLAPAVMGVTGAADLLNLATAKFPALGKAQEVATKAMALAQSGLNAVMAGNPIALVIIALVALVAIFVIAYKKSETFRDIVDAAFASLKAVADKVFPAIKDAIVTAFNFIKEKVVPVVLAMKDQIVAIWNAIRDKTSAVWETIKDFVVNPMATTRTVVANAVEAIRDKIDAAWDTVRTKTANVYDGIKTTITDKFGDVVEYIKSIPGKLADLGGKFRDAGAGLMRNIVDGIKQSAGFIGDVASGIWEAVKSMINQAIGQINNALEFNITIAGKTFGVNAPDIPALASGGIVTRPTLALIGEAGPEAVIPLNGKYGGGGTNVYYITVNAPVGSSSAAIGRELTKHMDAYARAGGRSRA